jgi:hypothetical protein
MAGDVAAADVPGNDPAVLVPPRTSAVPLPSKSPISPTLPERIDRIELVMADDGDAAIELPAYRHAGVVPQGDIALAVLIA